MRCLSLIVLAVALTAIAGAQSQTMSSSTPKAFQLKADAFDAGAPIPRQYTCDGADQSPHLHWTDPPAGTVSVALVMDDPDAPSGVWVHWVAWNIVSTHGVAENFPKQSEVPPGTRQGRNSFGKVGYNGPCPPQGQTHRYFFRVYAVDSKLDLPAGASRAELDSALKGHVLAEAEYMGTYHH